MSDNSASEKETARERYFRSTQDGDRTDACHGRASDTGRGNIGPDMNQDKIKSTPTLAERHGIHISQRSHHERLAWRTKPGCTAEAKRIKIEYDILMSENNSRPRRPVHLHHPGNSKPCVNCGGKGHQLADCITAVHGYIKACVFCETDSHRTEDCDSFKKLSLADKVKFLVTDRAGKPALVQWWTLLYEFLEAKETRDIPPPTSFPWTVKYAVEVFEGKHGNPVYEIQREFDVTHNAEVLPVDTTVRSLPDVWSYYWFIECRPFPLRAHILRF
ncbi:hypothetical protein FMEXI_5652 [Fusarium mexicanum]|uniref:CCHC-type domain-containing protein n=1 Tax=Fusarium mexicanum TaxID=751941 RepID=A0A8H5J4P8_9HYPO|nr:hypothetical protein FMEXI_5652 [Fusarium mexicanum]